jgi:hypothetical protein
MAKVLYGNGVANMSGSQQGTVHSHNQFGSYTRGRVVPVNPQSSNQTLARSRFSAVAQSWRELTDAQRLDWAALGAQIVRSDSLGQTYTLKGFNAYCLINAHNLANGVALVNIAPPLDQAPVVTIGAITIDDVDIFTMAYTAVGGVAGNSIEVWATPPVSAGKTYANPSTFKKLGKYAGNVASPVDLLDEYLAVFGDSQIGHDGERVFLEVRPFSTNGIPGPVVRKSALIAAAV